MKKFIVITTSESSDHYMYFIEHHKKPTTKEIKEWLKENGTDVDDERCYEDIDEIEEITTFQKLTK
jgi:hypothetical protein